MKDSFNDLAQLERLLNDVDTDSRWRGTLLTDGRETIVSSVSWWFLMVPSWILTGYNASFKWRGNFDLQWLMKDYCAAKGLMMIIF